MSSLTSGNTLKFSALSLLLLSSATFAQTDAPATDKVGGEQGEIFPIPESVTNVKELMKFVQEVDNLEPEGLNEEQELAHNRKIARTVVAAAEQVASAKISDEDAMQSVYLKLQGLSILRELGEPKAGELLNKAIDAAQADKRPDVQAVGMKFMVESGFAQWRAWGKEERAELIDKIVKNISAREPEGSQIDLVMAVVDFLGDRNGEENARQLLGKLLPHFKASDDPQILQALALLEGIQRRLSLPGNPIQLKGTLLDGSQLDWKSYRGKVVLVDFWATWCGPCRAEVPNVLKMYRDYHDKGFEVLGISLDERREQAESYIRQEEIPWSTMFSDNPTERGWRHPMALRYGITGIPRAILVDREGKVVHMTARGANLGRELRRLLGEPVARANQSTQDFVQQVSNLTSEN
ncbi:MAG: TlpA family protein disulfide reductase [Bythopirellula sp.]